MFIMQPPVVTGCAPVVTGYARRAVRRRRGRRRSAAPCFAARTSPPAPVRPRRPRAAWPQSVLLQLVVRVQPPVVSG